MELDTDDQMSSTSNAQGIAMPANNHFDPNSAVKNLKNILWVAILENDKELAEKCIRTAKRKGLDLLEESESVKWNSETVNSRFLRAAKS